MAGPFPETLAGVPERARALLYGAVDLHVHAGPDPFAERRLDALALARDYREAGLAGFVLKSHEYPTQALAWAVAQVVEDIRIAGAIALDRGVGGLNPDALEAALRMGTRVVWMPTFDTAWSRANFGRWHSRGEPVRVLDAGGALLPEARECLALVDEHEATLCTGHLSPEETLAVVQEARGRGIRTVVTHPTPFGIPRAVQEQCAALGAYVEHCANTSFKEDGAEQAAAMVADARAVGVERVVLSTDLGQAGNPHPAVGLALWAEVFLAAGFSEDEVRRMVSANARDALGW
ncbi:MAG: DUF6282 family protein [Dehalococcoidia bacterium]|nr:DUF6282 family protein [Dehalococcoidia bacterium]